MDGDLRGKAPPVVRKRWTGKEDRQLLELARLMTIDRVAELIGRPTSTVERRLAILRRRENLFSKPAWTAEELSVLCACETVEQAVALLSGSRAPRAIRQRYQRMKDDDGAPKGVGWSAEDDATLRTHWGSKSRHELAEALGRSPSAVSYRAWFLELSGRTARA
jgi:hypothetical protein